jgi:hypothetical protein
MKAEILEVTHEEVWDLSSRLLDPETGRIKLLPAAEFEGIPRDLFRAWCGQQARYGIPTLELIQWLKERIGDRKAIEVGCGNADIGYYLGITQTDSCLQQTPAMRLMYAAMGGQIPTRPREDVLPLDAESAVQKLKPDVVVASWLTRRFIKGVDVEGQAEASVYGPEEEKILKGCAEYIHIGNLNVHSQKTLLQIPHEFYQFPWLVSRAADQSMNCIYVWKNSYYPNGRRERK